MAKPSRDELRQELNTQIANAKAELEAIKSELQSLHAEKAAMNADASDFKNKLKTDFAAETASSISDIAEKLEEFDSQLEELKEAKETFVEEKDSCLENIKTETSQAIQKHEKLLSEKFQEKHDQEKDSWFKKMQSWAEQKNKAFTEKLEIFVESETGKAANIVSQDLLSKESRDLASNKSDQIMWAEIKLTIALALMLVIGVILYYYTQQMDFWSILYKVLMFVPFGFYIWLQVRQMKRETCLRDRYHHKQLVMASYSAFFGFLKNNKKFTEEKQLQMTEQMFAEVRDNAADKADNNEIERLKLQNALLSKAIKKLPNLDKLDQTLSRAIELLSDRSESNHDTQD